MTVIRDEQPGQVRLCGEDRSQCVVVWDPELRGDSIAGLTEGDWEDVVFSGQDFDNTEVQVFDGQSTGLLAMVVAAAVAVASFAAQSVPFTP